ncbi:MAG TPA: ABC transporter ATP-binding protein [Candidatus Dormibacteraeota bacterium]|nr:ABC transporter ATP-binding protein [Candidatus Dormibacteraeota bacterium]
MWRFLYRNLRGHRLVVGFAVSLTFIQVAADILTAFPLKFILDKIVHHTDPVVPVVGGLLSRFDPLGTRNGLNDNEIHTQMGVVIFSAVLLLALSLLSAVLSYIQVLIAARVGANLSARLRTRLFEHLQHLSLDWHGRQRTGDLVQRITGNILDVEKLVTDGLVDLLAGVLTLVGIMVVMLALNWRFTVLCMVIVPALALTVLRYTLAIKRANKVKAKAAGQVAEVATEDIGAITEVKAFTLEAREAAHFRGYSNRLWAASWRAGRLQAEFTPIVAVLIALSSVTIISVGGWIAAGHGHTFGIGPFLIADGTLTTGSLTIFLTYSKQLYQPMRNLSKLMNLASSAAAGAARIDEVLLQRPEVKEAPVAYSGPARVRGDLAFDGVVFGYDAGQPVLTGIDLRVPAGRRVALVGLSGSGKTTMVKLIPRFYEVWDGTITVDGLDVRSYPLETLRGNVSLVLQDSVLFEGTIRDNIALGREDAADEEIVAAARLAHIHDQIAALPDGYASQVREQGKNFSSGQRQRLAIARALLRDAPILILDEPTANLDVEAEGEVMRAIDRLVVGRTVLMISHRLSTLGNVDEIVVLQNGRIVERGAYTELRRAGGVFARMLEEQSRYSAERLTRDLRGRRSTVAVGAGTARRAPAPPPPSARLQDIVVGIRDELAAGAPLSNGNGHRRSGGRAAS